MQRFPISDYILASELARVRGGVGLEGVKSVAQNLLKHLGASTCWCKWEGPVGRPGI